MRRAAALLVGVVVVTACGGSGADSAHDRLERIALRPADAGERFAQVNARTITNDAAARARPDTRQAREQYEDWGRVLQYTVQLAPPADDIALFSPEIARIINSATLFEDDIGAAASFAWTRELETGRLADIVVSEGAGTQITETRATLLDDVPGHGDDSFAVRLSAEATFEDGQTTAFLADVVFVRVGRVTGSVAVVAFGQAPRRDELLRLAAAFADRARSEQE